MYYITGVYRTDVTTSKHINLKETDVFEAGHTYELELWLRANDGYKFKTDSDGWIDITATVGGKEAEVVLPGASNAAIITMSYTLDEQPEIMLGDVDGDGSVTIIDATHIQRHLAELKLLDEAQLKRADTLKDGSVSILDATQIQLFVAEIIPGF